MTAKGLCSSLVFFMVFGCAGAVDTGGRSDETARRRRSAGQARTAMGSIMLRDVDGRDVYIDDRVAGNVALVSFFATYCEPCKKKALDHQELYDKYGKRGLVIIAISVDEPETSGQVRPFVRSRGLTYPVLMDTDFEAVRQFNPRRTLPFSMLFGRDGRITWTHEGYVPGDDDLFERKVAEALGSAR